MEAESDGMTHTLNVKCIGSGMQANKTAIRIPVSRCGMTGFLPVRGPVRCLLRPWKQSEPSRCSYR